MSDISSLQERKLIRLRPGEHHIALEQIDAYLAEVDDPCIFHRAHQLVMVTRGATSTADELQFEDCQPGIRVVPVSALRVELSRRFKFQQPLEGGDLRTVNCPKDLAVAYSELGSWKIPSLRTIIRAPLVMGNGSILWEEGFNRKTGLYLDFSMGCFDHLSEGVTKEQATRGLQDLAAPFNDFPFVSETDRSAFLAGILTGIIRPILPAAPMFVITAPLPGSGKSLLCDALAIIVSGRCAFAMSSGVDEEEMRKRVTSLLISGQPIACFDNVEKPIRSQSLCSVLTQEQWQDRVLGRSEVVALSTSTTWIANGNNLQVHGDLSTRVVIAGLDPGCERPDLRMFSGDLRETIRLSRRKLLEAAISIIAGYFHAGCPELNLVPLGRFEKWSKLVRNALVFAGASDPCAGLSHKLGDDPSQLALIRVLDLWFAIFGQKPIQARELLDQLDNLTGSTSEELRDLLIEIVGEARRGNQARRLGVWLAAQKGKIVKGFRIGEGGNIKGTKFWMVEPLEAQVGGGRSKSTPQDFHPSNIQGDCLAPTSTNLIPTECNELGI